jgi:hypothetical protein
MIGGIIGLGDPLAHGWPQADSPTRLGEVL